MIKVFFVLLMLLAPLHAQSERATREDDGKQTREPEGKKKGKAQEMVRRFFSVHDTNEDGKVDYEEFSRGKRAINLAEEMRTKIFSRFDKNGDGVIEKKEMKRGEFGPRRTLEKWDANGDGRVSFEEFKNRPNAENMLEPRLRGVFDRLDQNGDGFIDRDDRPDRGNGPPHPRRPHLRRKMKDLNGDGEINFEEFAAAPWHRDLSEDELRARFKMRDRNGDGKLSKGEIPQKRAPHQRDGRERGKRGEREATKKRQR